MRLFLGIDLPQEAKKSLLEQIEPLQKQYPQFRWVDPENYHLTLHFFGEVMQYADIAKRITDILYDAEAFYLYALKLDIFVRRQLLLYLDFKRQKKLEDIVTTIRTDLGLEKITDFIPHITLSRSALSSKQQYFALQNKIEKVDINLEFNVESIFLFQSILTGNRPVYKKLEEFKLL